MPLRLVPETAAPGSSKYGYIYSLTKQNKAMQFTRLLKAGPYKRWPATKKLLLYMKLTAILLLVTAMQLSANGFSQKVTLNCRNWPAKKVFNQIVRQTGVSIIYKESQIAQLAPLNISVREASIEEVLHICFKGLPYQFKIENNSIIISNAPAAQAGRAENKDALLVKLTGIVVSADGARPLAGASVGIKNTRFGTTTSESGRFILETRETSGTLVISYVGYAAKEINFSGTDEFRIVLDPVENKANEAVVVTALGVSRSNRSLSYNVQQVNTEELNTVKQTNLVNSLSGKVAGMSISQSASGVGGSAKVILRGSRSVNGSNQPLYVIDGVPMQNTGNANGQIATFYGGGFSEGGDGISNLNPDDIASISVLEGASAAALYGSQAQNGVILITTKKGRQGKAEISFTSSYQNSHIAYKPEFQNHYGAVAGQTSGDISSWGDKISSAPDNLKAYFRDGANITNSVSLSAGNQLARTYFSYANTHATGVQPENKLNRHNFNLREIGSFLNDKLTVDASLMYIYQDIENSPFIGAFPNPLLSLYLFPRGVDINPYKQDYFRPDSIRLARQNWITKGAGDFHQESPWWIVYKEPNSAIRNRFLVTASVKYEVANWLNLQVRGNLDRSADLSEQKFYQGTNGGYDIGGTGTYRYNSLTRTQKYADAIVNFKLPLQTKDIKIGGLAGASVTDVISAGVTASGTLSTPDYFTLTNIIAKNATPVSPGMVSVPAVLNPTTAVAPGHHQLQAVFGNLDFSFRDWAYLNITARNDWSSALAYTNNMHYFYPSAGLSIIVSQMTKLPEFISYAKLRGSLAAVGNTIPVYLTYLQNSQNVSGSLVFNTNQAPVTLKPERTKSMEAGIDLKFMANRLSASFTYYKSNTLNQYFPFSPSPASLVTTAYINAGNVQNTGYEFLFGFDVLKSSNFTWNTSVNGSSNKNKILEVRDTSSNTFIISNDNNGYQSVIRKGGSYGDIFAFDFVRDNQGRIVMTGDGSSGAPYKPTKTGFVFAGNANPKFQLGWSNSFTYKNFNFHLLVDGRFGGKVMSVTQAYMDFMGVSAESGEARDKGGVSVNGVASDGKPVTSVDPKIWYTTIGARGAMTGAYMYDATVVRLREASLGYTWPVVNSAVKGLRVALTARNLLYFYKKAPYDPEVTISTGNGASGIDAFNQPATRDIGINVNVIF